MSVETKITQAVEVLKSRDATPENLAMIQVFYGAFEWFDNFEHDGPHTYPDGRPMNPDRIFKVAAWGRGVVALADAVLGDD